MYVLSFIYLTLQKIAYAKTDSDFIAKQKGTYKERGSKRKEEEKKKKKGKEPKGMSAVPNAGPTPVSGLYTCLERFYTHSWGWELRIS